MTINELMIGLQMIIDVFSSPLFIAFTLMIAISAAYGVKKLILE